MKKFVLFVGLFSFIMFGALGIQNVLSATNHMEFVKFDKDPKKNKDKKNKDVAPAAVPAQDTKDVNATTTPAATTKTEGAKSPSCCSHPKEGCCAKEKKDNCTPKPDSPKDSPEKK
jgi:hypothetical protein